MQERNGYLQSIVGLFADLLNKCVEYAHSVTGTVLGAENIIVKRQAQP